jgi:hypothetical protein
MSVVSLVLAPWFVQIHDLERWRGRDCPCSRIVEFLQRLIG